MILIFPGVLNYPIIPHEVLQIIPAILSVRKERSGENVLLLSSLARSIDLTSMP